MSERQKPRASRSRDRDQDEQLEHRRHREEQRHNSGEHKIFADLVQRRLGGGATPTAEAYAKAMQQWQKLPGAVGFTAVPAFLKTGPGHHPVEPEEFENGGETE